MNGAAILDLLGSIGIPFDTFASITRLGLLNSDRFIGYSVAAGVQGRPVGRTTGKVWSRAPQRVLPQPQGQPHLQAVVTDIPDQTVAEGGSFTSINLDDYVSDAIYTDAQMVWTYFGNTSLSVSIVDRVATIGIPNADWNGVETITFRATPPVGSYGENAATFTVTAVNDAPTDISLSASSVAENSHNNTVVGTLSTTDPDANSTFTYSLVSGTGSDDNISFNIVGANLRASAVFNFEAKSSYSILVRSTDQGGLFFDKQFTITVTNVNETPTDIGLSASSVAENTPIDTVVGALSTTDPDANNTFTYSLVSGTGSDDNASFIIVGADLRTSAVFNFEAKSSYSILIRSTDQGGLFFDKQFTITVTNVNETPTDIGLSASSVAENALINTGVGTLSTTDPDANNTFTYSLVSGTGSVDNISFNIVGANLRTSAVFNFEAKSSYSILIRSTDQGGLFFDKQFTITVTNVNETPTDISLSGSAVAENALIDTVVGAFSTSDPDVGNTFTYSLVSGTGSVDNASFNIVGADLRTSVLLDYETKSSYSIRIRSTDQGSLWVEKQFTITVTFIDTIKPTVSWVYPVGDEKGYFVPNGNRYVLLLVTAVDNAGIVQVRFFRWDPKLGQNGRYVDIAILYNTPYEWNLDTTNLNYGWNEIDARAYDTAGNFSDQMYILIYRWANIYLPFVATK